MYGTKGYKTRQSASVLHSCLGFGKPSGNSWRRLRTNKGHENDRGRVSENGVGITCIGAEETIIKDNVFTSLTFDHGDGVQ